MPTQRTYQCIHNKIHTPLIVQEHRLSIAPQIVEAIPQPNKVTKLWIGILSLFKLSYMPRPYAHVLLIVTTAQTTVYFTCVNMATVPYYICCKYLLSPFVLYMCFHLGSRICLRGRKSTLKSMDSSKNCMAFKWQQVQTC